MILEVAPPKGGCPFKINNNTINKLLRERKEEKEYENCKHNKIIRYEQSKNNGH